MDFEKLNDKLVSLLDESPSKAIDEALKIDVDEGERFLLLKAAILVDAGADANRNEIVKIGVEIFQYILFNHPENSEITYNLANGFSALANTTARIDFTWYQETNINRSRAKNLFYQAIKNPTATIDTKSKSLTNIGNSHWASYRWVEAYDFYIAALKENAENGVASSGALKMLRYGLYQGIGDYDLLVEEIENLAAHVTKNRGAIEEYAGKNSTEVIFSEIIDIPINESNSIHQYEDDFIEFVIKNNLTLSPTLHLVRHDVDRWDNLTISSVTSEVAEGSDIPSIFAMFNVIKSDYILARKLYYDALSKVFFDSGTYSDTLDYACYGVNEAALALAQRAALDILDKIAVATLSYLKIGGARSTSFKKAWFQNNSNPKVLSPGILDEIMYNNSALLALSEISNDLTDKNGYLANKQDARNSSTHRFTILHDMGTPKGNNSNCLKHFNYDDFNTETLLTLKLARASIIYFVQMIKFKEERVSDEKEGIFMPMEVPYHHEIRGHDDEYD